MITVGSNNTSIDNTSVSKITVDTTINVADRGGVAGGLKIEDAFNTTDINLKTVDVTKIEDSFNDNAVALDNGVAVAASHNKVGF